MYWCDLRVWCNGPDCTANSAAGQELWRGSDGDFSTEAHSATSWHPVGRMEFTQQQYVTLMEITDDLGSWVWNCNEHTNALAAAD